MEPVLTKMDAAGMGDQVRAQMKTTFKEEMDQQQAVIDVQFEVTVVCLPSA
jgi:hypothetical protein